MPRSTRENDRVTRAIGALGLAAAVCVLYAPALELPFLHYEDAIYVANNPNVAKGLGWSGLRWAFGESHAGNWIPLTWLSHMLDVEIFGLAPSGHHATNVGLHALNAALLFVLLQRATGALGASLFAAALFALHPLRVESVAWISERKDLLCGFFWLAALACHGRACESNSRLWRSATLAATAAALLAKPMAVTLPFALLLWDVWPLSRLRPLDSGSPRARRGLRRIGIDPARLRAAALEKWPLFALAAACAAIALAVPAAGGQVGDGALFPLPVRLANAALAYVAYLRKLLWPSDLAFLYPHAMGATSLVAGAACAGLLAALSAAVAWQARVRPWLFVGWFWFLGVLVPVIGIVQAGAQAMADRFTYLPAIGLCVAIAWTGRELAGRSPLARTSLAVLAAGSLMGFSAVTAATLPMWRSDIALYERAIEIARRDGVGGWLAMLPHYHLAGELARAGRSDDAVARYREALHMHPGYAPAHYELGVLLRERGEEAAADAHFEAVVVIARGSPPGALGFAELLYADRKPGAAEWVLRAELAANPGNAQLIRAVEEIRSRHPGP